MVGRKTGLGSIIKWIIIVFLIVVAGKKVVNYIAPEVIDVTNLVDIKKQKLEEQLELSLTSNPNMVKKIYQYSEGEVTVDSDDDANIAIVYIDGKQTGLHIDHKKYSMYGLHMGDAIISIENKMTYEYDDCFEVIEDMYDGSSTAIFYCNRKRGDCLVVISNDITNRVVALTYFSDLDKVTEQLI